MKLFLNQSNSEAARSRHENSKIKVALCTTDNREHARRYALPAPIFGSAPEALLEGFAKLPNLEIHVLSCIQKPASSPCKLDNNIFFHSLHVPRGGWLRSGYAGCIGAVRRKLGAIQPDLVHGQGTERDCAIEAVLSGFSNLITLHGNIRSVAKRLRSRPFSYYWIQSFLETLALKKTNGVLCNSGYTRSLVIPLNPRTYLVPNAARGIFFKAPRKITKSVLGGLKLLMVGTITPYKQALEFLRFLRAWRQEPNFPIQKCCWVGSVDCNLKYARDFLEEVTIARSQGWAEHFPELPPSLLIEKMDASDALVHLPTEEAFGLVVAEAMIRGLPIMAAKTGGLPDFASSYPMIRLVPNQPCLEWKEVLASPSFRAPRVPLDSWPSEVYLPQNVARKHIEIYREIIASR